MRGCYRGDPARVEVMALLHIIETASLVSHPLAPHRARRHIERLGCFLFTQPAEKAQFHHPASARINRCQSIERLIKGDELGAPLDTAAASSSETCMPRCRACPADERGRSPPECAASTAPPLHRHRARAAIPPAEHDVVSPDLFPLRFDTSES